MTFHKNLFPSSFLVFKRRHQPFSLGVFSLQPGHLFSLLAGTPCLSVSTCLPNRLKLAQGFRNYWSVGKERMNAKTHQQIWSECFWGEQLPNPCSSSSVISSSPFAFSPLLPPLKAQTKLGKESRFWEWITSQHSPSWDSFLFGNSARNHTYATEISTHLNLL